MNKKCYLCHSDLIEEEKEEGVCLGCQEDMIEDAETNFNKMKHKEKYGFD